MSVKLSQSNKMPCQSWSLEAVKTCPASKDSKGDLVDACEGCYAREGNYRFKNVKDAREHNRLDWRRDDWVDDMVAEIDNDRYFRWFDSGDMYHIKLAEKILEVMRRTDWCQHWLPTRMHKIKKFQSVIKQMESLPNVVVRLSSDSVNGEIIEGNTTSTIVEGLKEIRNPTTRKIEKKIFVGVVPKGTELCRAFERSGKCGTCRACWDKKIKVITYPAHGNKMKKVIKLAIAR